MHTQLLMDYHFTLSLLFGLSDLDGSFVLDEATHKEVTITRA
jgi:hypothetical protein